MKLETRQELLGQILLFTKKIQDNENITDDKLNNILKILLMANDLVTDELDLIDLTTENKGSTNMTETEINERLNKHFEMPKAKILKARTRDNEFEVNEYYEHNLLQALNNSTIAEQSDINRIRSLKNTGATLTEAIKTVIPKRKHKAVLDLVKVQRAKFTEFKAVQERLK